MQSITLIEYLNLPNGWTALRFPSSLTIYNPKGEVAGSFHAADLQNKELARENAREIINKET